MGAMLEIGKREKEDGKEGDRESCWGGRGQIIIEGVEQDEDEEEQTRRATQKERDKGSKDKLDTRK